MRDDNQQFPSGFVGPGPATNPGTEEVPPLFISNWHRTVSSFGSAFVSGNVMRGYRAKRDHVLQADTSTPLLTDDEVSEIKKNRPGIVFPLQVRKSTSDAIVKDYDNDRLRNDILNSTEPGTTGKLLGGVSRLLGSSLASPVKNLLEIGVADELPISRLIGVDRDALGESLAKRSINMIKTGAAKGAVFGTIQDAESDASDIMNGESFSPTENIYNIAQNMFWGGALGPVHEFMGAGSSKIRQLFKNREFVDRDGVNDVNTTSGINMENGQDPNVEVPINHAVERSIKNLHKEMNDSGLSKDDVLSSLDTAKDNIDTGMKKFQGKIDDIIAGRDEGDLSDDEKKQVGTFREKLANLDIASKSQEAYRFMVENDDFSVTPNQYQQYGSQIDNPNMDFAQGRGHEDLDNLGAPIKNENDLLQDRFDPQSQKELLDESDLTESQEDELDKIKRHPKSMDLLSKGINAAIMCLTG